VLKDVKVKTADDSVTFEGRASAEDAKAFVSKFVEMMQRELNRGRP